jgi:hypothetical protein
MLLNVVVRKTVPQSYVAVKSMGDAKELVVPILSELIKNCKCSDQPVIL